MNFSWSKRAFLLSLVLLGCGIPLGRGTPNDKVPTGTEIANGPITGFGVNPATGFARIYNTGSSYVLRLETFNVNPENGLQVVVTLAVNSQVVLRSSLRSVSGNQNYTIGAVAGQFSSVEIYSTAAQTNYGVAALHYTGNGT